jgi:RNA:NAD 2'-phosphotransferase (TPT1/KptA family)
MSESEIEVETGDEKVNDLKIRSKIKEKLSKRLSYILRYGASKEGLKIHDGGFVKLNELLEIPMLKNNPVWQNNNENDDFKSVRRFNFQELLMEELKTSTSHRKISRFELKEINNETFVRATYGRKFTRSPFHDDSKVERLLEISLNYIVKNINNYDFEGFKDEYLIKSVII